MTPILSRCVRRVCLTGMTLWSLLLLVSCQSQNDAKSVPTAPDAITPSPVKTSPLIAKDGRGIEISLSAPPRRIVSLSPGTTEMLFALGLQGRIVADTTYCDYPPEAKDLPHIGDVNTSVEKVIAQKPDLVIASTSANRRAINELESLSSVKMNVFAVDPKNLTETVAALRLLGQITGQNDEAEKLIAGIEQRVKAVHDALQKENALPKVLMIVQAEPLMVVGGGNFMDDLITQAGGINVGRHAGDGWKTYSPEQVVTDAPDFILSGRETAERLRQQAGWSGVPAIRNNQIITLQNESARPGPRLVETLEELARKLHPGAFSAYR